MALTPEQFAKLRTQLGGQVTAPQAPARSESFLGNLGAAYNDRVGNIDQARNKALAGEQSHVSGLWQSAGQVVGFLGDAALEGIKAVTPAPIENAVGGAVGGFVKQAIENNPRNQERIQQYQAFKLQHPEAAANLEATGLISSILPVGMGAKATGLAAGMATKGVGAATAGTGRVVSGAGKALYNTAFTPNIQSAEQILNYQARVPFLSRVANAVTGNPDPRKPRVIGDTAIEKGILGTEKMAGVQAKREANKLWNDKIAPAVKNSPATMTADELFAPAQELINKTVDPTRRNALQTALDSLRDDYADFDNISLETAQALKRDLDKFTPAKMFRGQDVSAAVKTLQHEMADAIRQKTYAALDNKQDYLDWANLDALADVGVKVISEARLKGGFGGFWSAMWDMATTPVKTVGGQVLYRVGNALEFVGDKGIKRFGDFLQGRGFVRPQDRNKPPTIPTAQSNSQVPKKKVSSSIAPSVTHARGDTPKN